MSAARESGGKTSSISCLLCTGAFDERGSSYGRSCDVVRSSQERVQDITPHFIEEWREMKSRLLPLFADGEPAEKRVLESSTMRTLLSILKNAVEEMDVDQADEIIQQLKEVSLPSENMQQALASLCAAVTDLDQKKLLPGVTDWRNYMKKNHAIFQDVLAKIK